MFDFPTVPELAIQKVEELTEDSLKNQILEWANEPSVFGSVDTQLGQDCTREGIVTRNIGEYAASDFAQNIFKYVRKGHVKTGEHWTRNWKRAQLVWERNI